MTSMTRDTELGGAAERSRSPVESPTQSGTPTLTLLRERDHAALARLRAALVTECDWAKELFFIGLRAREAWAWEAFASWYRNFIFEICFAILRDVDLATDVMGAVQDDFVYVYAHHPRAQETFPGYLHKMARHRALRQLKDCRRHVAGEFDHLAVPTDSDEAAHWHHEIARAASVLNELNPEHVTLLRERFAEGLSYEEIASRRGVTLQAIHKRVTKLLQVIRKRLNG